MPGPYSDTQGIAIEQATLVDTGGTPLVLGGALRSISQPYTVALDYDGSGNLIYLGIAVTGTSQATAAWYIRQLNYTGGNLVSILNANGTTAFNSVWTNRASLSYS